MNERFEWMDTILTEWKEWEDYERDMLNDPYEMEHWDERMNAYLMEEDKKMTIYVTHTYTDGRPDALTTLEATATAAWAYHAFWCHLRTVKRAVVTNAL